jgi:hypothetical protein
MVEIRGFRGWVTEEDVVPNCFWNLLVTYAKLKIYKRERERERERERCIM